MKFWEFTRIIFVSLQEVIIFYINIYMIIQIYTYEIKVQSQILNILMASSTKYKPISTKKRGKNKPRPY